MALVLADRDFLLCCAVVGEKEPSNPTVTFRALWPKTTHKGNGTRHHNHCPWTVVSGLLAPGREIPPRRIPTAGTAAAPLCRLSVIVLQQTTQSLLASNHPSAIRSWRTGSRKQDCVVLALMISFGVVTFAESLSGRGATRIPRPK